MIALQVHVAPGMSRMTSVTEALELANRLNTAVVLPWNYGIQFLIKPGDDAGKLYTDLGKLCDTMAQTGRNYF